MGGSYPYASRYRKCRAGHQVRRRLTRLVRPMLFVVVQTPPSCMGAMVHVALKAAEALSTEGKEVEVIDLRTLAPFDSGTCVDSVNRTGRLLVLQEAQYTGGWDTRSAVDSGAMLLESRIPPVVVGALDTPFHSHQPWKITPSQLLNWW